MGFEHSKMTLPQYQHPLTHLEDSSLFFFFFFFEPAYNPTSTLIKNHSFGCSVKKTGVMWVLASLIFKRQGGDDS